MLRNQNLDGFSPNLENKPNLLMLQVDLADIDT